ncbi:MAG: hypothetical protein ACTSRA_00225 [Promethearchaeota archaeon]|nr:MAG: hypothetical protein [Helarchaeota virus Nidhogg Meg22_1012]URC17380.1 MAG: hypothetical protein [Helarchaeota virus Nidhogg Meg22_1214]
MTVTMTLYNTKAEFDTAAAEVSSSDIVNAGVAQRYPGKLVYYLVVKS